MLKYSKTKSSPPSVSVNNNNNNNNNNSEFIIARFCKKKNPKRAACASLVEREGKGFEVAPKR